MEEKQILTSIGKRIKEERKQRGLTQKELASQIGTHGHTVSRWENGTYKIGLAELQSIAELFQLDLIDFFPAKSNSFTSNQNQACACCYCQSQRRY